MQLTLCQTYGLSAALVITTPQRLARVDVEKGIDMFRELAVPIIGLVENMAYFTDGHGEVHYPFGTSQLEAVREYAGVARTPPFGCPSRPQSAPRAMPALRSSWRTRRAPPRVLSRRRRRS